MNAWSNDSRGYRFGTLWLLGIVPWVVAWMCIAPERAYATPPPSKAEASQRAHDAQTAAMERLLNALHELPGIEAQFKEEKHLQLLALPLESEGVLYFHKDGYLLRTIEKPTASSIRITPKTVTIEEGGKTQRIDLSSHQEIGHMVQSFLWILAGDVTALRAHFRLAFECEDPTQKTPEQWTLTLHPTHEKVRKLLQKIVVRGSGVTVRELRIEEQGGDVTHTQILRVNTQRSFSKEESRALFGRAL